MTVMKKIFVLLTYTSYVQMATIEEGRRCHVDANCSVEQYCYEVSGQCVDYAQCSRYNREEGSRRSRDPSNCGRCLPGYTTEVLGTGEEAILCKKSKMFDNSSEPGISNTVISIIVIGAVSFVITLALALFLRKRLCAFWKKYNSKQRSELCALGPTAPPAENCPFISIGDHLTNEPMKNNQHPKDKNKLLKATPCKEPDWVRINPDYDHNLNNDNLSQSDHLRSLVQQQPADSNSNAWIPEEMTIQVMNGALTEHRLEERDNNVNAALVQRNYPSTSNGSGHSNSNSSDNNNNATGSSSESSYTQDNRGRVRPNILITQKISTNVNVLNAG